MRHISTHLDRVLKRSQEMNPAPRQQRAQVSPPTNGQQHPSSTLRSKYEMNLAEFPLAILSKQAPKDLKIMVIEPKKGQKMEVGIIQYEDTIEGKNGEIVPRQWTVLPSLRYGFGSPQMVSLLFEIFQIWKEQDFATPYIRFHSLSELIRRVQLQKTATAYHRLRHDLSALVDISIIAKNAFWDNVAGGYVDAEFHLFDEVHFYYKEATSRQHTLPLAYIKASEKLFGSVQANTLTTLKLPSAYFHQLTPAEQRLGLYLAKMLYRKTTYRRDIVKLAEQLPLHAKTYKHTKYLLTRICDGLLAKKFPHLTSYHYEPKRTKRRHNIVFYHQKPEQKRAPQHGQPDMDQARIDDLIEEILAVTGDRKNTAWYQLIAQKLAYDTIYTALSETKYAHHQRQIRKTKAQYFTDTIKRYAEQQGIVLNPKKQERGRAVDKSEV
jgi:hypothetical protein